MTIRRLSAGKNEILSKWTGFKGKEKKKKKRENGRAGNTIIIGILHTDFQRNEQNCHEVERARGKEEVATVRG